MTNSYQGLPDWAIIAFEMECIHRILRGEGTKLDYELFPPYHNYEWFVDLLRRYEENHAELL